MLTFDSQEVPVSSAMRQTAGSGPTMIVPASPVDKTPYQLEWEDFLSVVDGKSQARVTPEDALRVVEIALAALKSADTGKPVRL